MSRVGQLRSRGARALIGTCVAAMSLCGCVAGSQPPGMSVRAELSELLRVRDGNSTLATFSADSFQFSGLDPIAGSWASAGILSVPLRFGLVSKALVLSPSGSVDGPFPCSVVYVAGHGALLGSGADQLVRVALTQGCVVGLLEMPFGGHSVGQITLAQQLGTLENGTQFDLGAKHLHEAMWDLDRATGGPVLDLFVASILGLQRFLDPRTTPEGPAVLIGHSGGAWLATLAGAVSPSFTDVMALNGTSPDPIKDAGYADYEQVVPAVLRIGVTNVYGLAAGWPGRTYVQFYNWFDACCFSGIDPADWAGEVSDAAAAVGGQFKFAVNYDPELGHDIQPLAALALRAILSAGLPEGELISEPALVQQLDSFATISR